MEISMDPFSKTFLNKISLNVTGYMEIFMDPLQVKAFMNNVSLIVTGYMEISVDSLGKSIFLIMLVSVLQGTWKFLWTLFDPFCKASEIYHNL